MSNVISVNADTANNLRSVRTRKNLTPLAQLRANDLGVKRKKRVAVSTFAKATAKLAAAGASRVFKPKAK